MKIWHASLQGEDYGARHGGDLWEELRRPQDRLPGGPGTPRRDWRSGRRAEKALPRVGSVSIGAQRELRILRYNTCFPDTGPVSRVRGGGGGGGDIFLTYPGI